MTTLLKSVFIAVAAVFAATSAFAGDVILPNGVTEASYGMAAKIGTEYYANLQSAVDASVDGAEIDIISDIALTAQNIQELMKKVYNRESYAGLIIPDDKSVILDLNGHTVSYTDTYGDIDNVMILNLGNLTVNDSLGGGKITYKPVAGTSKYTKFYSTVFNCGTLIVNAGTIENTAEAATDVTNAVDNHSRLSHEYGNDSILVVNGGILSGAYYYAVRQYTHYLEGVQNRVTINGGVIKGGVYMQHGDSWYYADASSNRLNVDSCLTINGGKITVNDTPDQFGKIKVRLNNPDNEVYGLYINDGVIEVPVELLVQKGYHYVNGTSGATTWESDGASNEEWLKENGGFISGGTFTDLGVSDSATDANLFLKDGFVFSGNDDGTYTVVEGPKGSLTNCYTSESTYWGECGGNAKKSFEFKFFNDDTYMGYTSLNNVGGIIDGDVLVPFHIKLDAASNTDEYWTMAWKIQPTLAMQPNRCEQWIDGVKVAECVVEPNGSDKIYPVVAAVTDEKGTILSYVNNTESATLAKAFAKGGYVTLLADAKLESMIEIPADKELVFDLNGKTVSGAEGVKISNLGDLTVKDTSEEMQGTLEVAFSNSGKAWLTGGCFAADFENNGTIQISGGAYPEKVGSNLLPAGYACSKVGEDEDAAYVVAKLPTATVTPVPDSELNGNELTFALKFKADKVSKLQSAAFGHWYADFVLSVNKEVTFNSDGKADGYLSGQYDAWSENWVNVPINESVTMKANESFKVMEYAAELMGESGLKVTYDDVCNSVKEFDCGVFFKPEFLVANPDLEVSLSLKMFNPEDETESYVIGIDYKFSPPAANDTVTVRDQNGVIVNCETMKNAIEAVIEKGDSVNGGEITIVKNSEISDDITITGTRNLFFDLGKDKTLTLAEGKKFALENVNVAFVGTGSLAGFTADNVVLDDKSVLTLPASAQSLAKSFEDAKKYVVKNADDTWSVANKFELQIQVTEDGASIGFLKDTRRTYTVEASSDLVTWAEVQSTDDTTTVGADAAVPLEWNKPQDGKFFRVRTTEPAVN